MEWKIGEIRQIKGEWYQCVKGEAEEKCTGCFFKASPICIDLNCLGNERKDHTKVIFKKLEKVGEPVTEKGRTFQKLTSGNNSCKECVFNVPNKACCKNSYIEGICDDNGFWVEIKQNKVDMEEKKIQHYDCFFDREPSKSNLKPFDLEAAKAGKPVCTRDGRRARVICFDRNAAEYHIVALIECKGFPSKGEEIKVYNNAGKYFANGESSHDLMMLPEKKEGWVNIVRGSDGKSHMGRGIFQSKEEAEDAIKAFNDNLIDTIKVSWEE